MVTSHPDRKPPALGAQPQLPQEIAMFRKSNLLSMSAANAMRLSLGAAPTSLAESVRLCPAGTHPGYEGKYCWRNHETDACPPGFHLGYEDKYCWRNH
jgi:hypothetical protein